MSEQELVNIKIDGKDLQVPKGSNMLKVCLSADSETDEYPDQNCGGDHYVPHFCYHPGLSVSGNCRMCFVKTKQEVRRGDKVIPMEMMTTACTNTVSEGIEIFTTGDDVEKVREGIMDLELINHPLDCPECDKAGECSLQDYAFDHGHASSMFDFDKVGGHIKGLSDKINFWGTRCIKCSRCIRVADEVSGTSELAFVNRGDRTVIDIFPNKPIDNDISLNVVDVCPVGALKNKDFQYSARVWNLDQLPGNCGLCAKGCSNRIDSLKGKVTRVMSRENENVNDFWLCDRGRLDYKWANCSSRIDQPQTRDNFVNWESGYDRAVEGLKSASENAGASWAIAHASATNEELYLFKKLIGHLGITNVAVMSETDVPALDFPKFKAPSDANANRAGVAIVLGVSDCEASVEEFARAAGSGGVENVFVFGGLPHGTPEVVTKALAAEEITNIVAVDFKKSMLSELANVTLACATYIETGGSWVNFEMLLQAFRPALRYAKEGRIGTEILQELLFRVDEAFGEEAESEETKVPLGKGDDSFIQNTRQRGWEGKSTVPVLDGTGEIATKTRKVVVSPAAVFSELADDVAQFGGHSHLKLIQSHGARLV
ncbi:MAG: NADH-quinone oxidoreductase subunit G [Planctomycetota bacterium]|jgi:NADH-quinone oxidoreductase subunit G